MPRAPQIEEHVPDPRLEGLGGDAAKQRGEPDPVVDVNARSAAAYGVDARKMRRRAAQRVHDAVPVVLRVALVVRVPLELFAPDDSAVHERRHLAVAPAEVEPDAAAVEVPAERRGGGPRGRQIRRRDHLDRVAVDAVPDDRRVEAARGAVAEMSAQPLDQRDGRVEVNAEAAARPQRELDQPLEHPGVGHGGGIVVREQIGREAGDSAVRLLEREAYVDRASGGPRALLEDALGQRGGAEQRVEHRRHARGDEGQASAVRRLGEGFHARKPGD